MQEVRAHVVDGNGHGHSMLIIKDQMTLELEGRRYKYTGAKAAAIRETFGESSTRYYQRLNALLDDPAALALAPLLVRRLRRLRDERRGARSEVRLGCADDRRSEGSAQTL